MTALPKICAVSGCVEQARPGRSYCAEHERSRPRSPSSVVTSSPGWKRARAAALRRDDRKCVRCGAPATNVDHIRDVAKGGAALDLENLRSLCGDCHGRRHADDRLASARERLENVTGSIDDRLRAKSEIRALSANPGPPSPGGTFGLLSDEIERVRELAPVPNVL